MDVAEDLKSPADPGEAEPHRGPQLSWPRAVALLLAACFLAGVIGWWIGQPRDPAFNDVDTGFLSDMTTHHNGAISLGFAYLGREHDPVVGHFAREIVTAQSQEIGRLNDLLSEAGNPPSSQDDIAMDWMGEPVEPTRMPGMATQAETERLRASAGLAADDEFTRLMIRHHAAGAEMAEYASRRGRNSTVKRFATAMALLQRTEIEEMNDRRVVLGLPAVAVTGGRDGHNDHGG